MLTMLRRGGRSSVSRLLLALAAGLLVSGAGCARFGAVSGKVYYQGKPLKGGMVHFYGPRGSVETSRIEPDGGYTLSRVPVGPAKVAVSTPVAGRISITIGSPPPAFRVVPARYGDPQQSGLTLEVHGGSQEHDIRLE
jgi:hypothetical protein